MRIVLLEKKVKGGGQIDPPPLPCNRWETKTVVKTSRKKAVLTLYMPSQGSENYQKIFLGEFLSFPKFEKKNHDNRTTTL